MIHVADDAHVTVELELPVVDEAWESHSGHF